MEKYLTTFHDRKIALKWRIENILNAGLAAGDNKTLILKPFNAFGKYSIMILLKHLQV